MTRDRIVNLLILALVTALTVWIARNTYWDEITVPIEAHGDAATNDYYGIEHLAGDLGIKTHQIHALDSLPPPTAVLLLGYQDRTLGKQRSEALRRWVEGGGRLLLIGRVDLGAIGDQQWAWTGVEQKAAKPELPRKLAPPAGTDGPQQRQDGVRDPCEALQVRVDDTATAESLRVCAAQSRVSLTTDRPTAWSLSSRGLSQVLRVPVGKGSVTVFGNSQLLANQSIVKGDHARIFFDAAALRHGDELWIHSSVPAEALAAIIWRRAAPAVDLLLLAIVLAIWRNLPRFGPMIPAPPTARRSLAEQIRANAAFARRTGRLEALHAASLRGVEDAARRRIAAYDRLAAELRTDALAAQSGIARDVVASALSGSTQRTDAQRASITVLEQIRRALQRPSEHNKRYRA